MTAAQILRREVEHTRIRLAAAPGTLPCVVCLIGRRPDWLYDPADFPGFTPEQIAAGLSVPALPMEGDEP